MSLWTLEHSHLDALGNIAYLWVNVLYKYEMFHDLFIISSPTHGSRYIKNCKVKVPGGKAGEIRTTQYVPGFLTWS